MITCQRDICKHQVFFCLMNAMFHFSPLKNSDSNEEVQAYIKKPPNAFMLFMKEQRPNVSKDLWEKGSGVVNSYLAAIVRGFCFCF